MRSPLAAVRRSLRTRSAAATEAAGRRLARHLEPGDVLLLEGELGAGKTTLVRGIAAGLGIEAAVMSPTYQLVRLYRGPLTLAHADLYRLDSGQSLDELGFDDELEDTILVVEWGDRLQRPGAARIRIDDEGDGARLLRLVEAPPAWSW
ncbi:MAG: tRNA (adenosine(37)-N6)-threonylcarbamoyltransferase complex ATPase subunit type 1 TsaE [Candidatus Dormiibacterota bacterium]